MKNLKYIVIFFLLFTETSCDKNLELVNPNDLSIAAIGQSESDLTLLLNGCYDALQKNHTDAYRWLDNFSGISFGDNNITDGASTPEEARYLLCWSRSYLLIGRCNELLSIIKGIQAPNTAIKTIESEALFLRSYAYYQLMVLFKDVPLVTSRQSFADRLVKKNTQAEIRTQITKDLDYVIQNLPINNRYPKVTKGAAMTLAAKVYANFSEWNKVSQLTNDLISLKKYSLYPSYDNLFSEAAENNSEAILSVAYLSGLGEGEAFSGIFSGSPNQMDPPLSNYADAFYCTDGKPIGKSPLYNKTKFFENRDPRYEVNILRDGDIINKQPFAAKFSVTGYFLQKYVRVNTTAYRDDGPVDFMIFRYADVLLLRAEALIESGQLTPEVYQLINQVRSRVKMPKVEDVEGANLTQAQLREIIRQERLVELGLEGDIRWFDIKRWNIVEQVYNSITFRKRPYRGEKTLFWPIPQTEIANNPNLVQHDWWK